MGNSKILVVGATGAIGPFITKASTQLGHPTFALVHPATAGPTPQRRSCFIHSRLLASQFWK